MKNWYRSKTVWLNIATVVILVLVAAPDAELFSMFQLKLLAYANVILNIILRVWFTDSGIRKYGQ